MIKFKQLSQTQSFVSFLDKDTFYHTKSYRYALDKALSNSQAQTMVRRHRRPVGVGGFLRQHVFFGVFIALMLLRTCH